MTKPTAELADLGALSSVAPDLADMLVAVASDIALVVSDEGVIERVALKGAETISAATEGWVGQLWSDTVTTESRKKIEALLKDVASTGMSRSRQVNHQSEFGANIPIAYTAVRLGHKGPVLAIGKDLRAVVATQQRLLQTQQEMERHHWRRRQDETRYRFLFQIGADAVIVVDATSLTVVDANRAAGRLFGLSSSQLNGKPAVFGFDPSSQANIDRLLAGVGATGRGDEAEAMLANARGKVRITVTAFRSEGAALLLMRLRDVEVSAASEDMRQHMAELVQHIPDAVVITNQDGRVIHANPGFTTLLRIDDHAGVKGRSLGDWLGDSGGGLPAMLAMVRRGGIINLLAASLRIDGVQAIDVELSAAALPHDDRGLIGFVIRAAHGNIHHGPLTAKGTGGQVH